jgi:hypothetical protein
MTYGEDPVKHFHILAMILSLGLLLTASASSVSRFDHTGPKGVYFTAGFTSGPARVHIDNQEQLDNSKNALGRNFRVGVVVHKCLLLGLECSTWLRARQGQDFFYQHYSFAATYYILPELFVKGGPAIGLASYELEGSGPFDFTYREYGSGVGFGAGADIRITHSFSFVPAIQYLYLDFEDSSASQLAIVFSIGWFW